MKKSAFISLFFLCACASYNNKIAEKAISKADLFFQKNDFKNAAKWYGIANNASKGKGINKKAAQAAVKIGDYSKAISFYTQIDKKEPLDLASLITLADLYKARLKYNDAKKTYNRLTTLDKENAEFYLKQSSYVDSLRLLASKNKKSKAVPLVQFNTSDNEISPFVFGDSLFFTSDFEGILVHPKKYIDGEKPFQTLVASFDLKAQKFSKPKKAVFNAKLFEDYSNLSFVSFTKDKKKLYFSCTSHNKTFSGDSSFRIKMYSADTDSNGNWQKPHTFIMNDLPYSFAHPFVEENNTMFFFSSDMAGGFGGTDIWVCINIENKWTDPINLGPKVNSPGNEMFPYFDTNGNLYFSSNYHPGFGGFDIFKAIQKDGEWNEVMNLGANINSSANEASISIKNDVIIFSSDKAGGNGKFDLYYTQK